MIKIALTLAMLLASIFLVAGFQLLAESIGVHDINGAILAITCIVTIALSARYL